MTKSYIDPNFKILSQNKECFSAEYLEYRKKWIEYPEKFITTNSPIHLDIETHTRCNLKCVMCFHSFDPPTPLKLPDEVVYRIIDEASKLGVCSIKFQYRGEPLLDKRIPDFVKYAKDKGIIEVMFNSNATLLTSSMINKLIESGLDKIICSVDGFEDGTYEKVRVGSNFHTILNNIRNLQKIKEERKSKTPILRVQTVENEYIENRIDEYLTFWRDIADDVGIEKLLNYNVQEEDTTIKKGFACAQLWQRLIILADGDVLPCCRATRGGNEKLMVVGNIFKNTVEEIWTNTLMNKIRELHKSGNSHELRMCRLCGLRELY